MFYQRHVLCSDKYEFLHTVLKRKFEGYRRISRRQTICLKNIHYYTGMKTIKLRRAAEDQKTLSIVIANVQKTE